jgi:hypothetical protein
LWIGVGWTSAGQVDCPRGRGQQRPGSCAGVLSLAGVSAWWRYDDYDKPGEDPSHWNKSGLSRYVVGEDDVFITVV